MTPDFNPSPDQAVRQAPQKFGYESEEPISGTIGGRHQHLNEDAGAGQILWPEKAARLKDQAPVLDKKFELYEKFGRTPGLLILEGGITQFSKPAGIVVNYVEGMEPSATMKQDIINAAKPHPVTFGVRSQAIVDAYTPTLGEEGPDSPFKDRMGADSVILTRHEALWKRCCGSPYVHGGGLHPYHDKAPELFLFLVQGVKVPEAFKQELRQIAHPFKLEFEERPIVRIGASQENQRTVKTETTATVEPVAQPRKEAAPAVETAPKTEPESQTLWQRFKRWLGSW